MKAAMNATDVKRLIRSGETCAVEFNQEPDQAVCGTCPRHCRIADGAVGFCRARRAKGGRVVAANYGQISSLALDPIEKKPIAFFHPGSNVLSVGSYGCNLRCPFCQNDGISQHGGDEVPCRMATPAELADLAARLRDEQGNIGLAYTYNEPLVGWEFVRDCANEIRARGMFNVLVSNGCANEENDSDADIDAVAAFVASVSPDIPLHVTRFFPRWRMSDASPTPIATVRRLADLARRRLSRVLVGNC